jgi:glyoxylase-like metal-dependent hydrolase (beta-lactamase superfamily II)
VFVFVLRLPLLPAAFCLTAFVIFGCPRVAFAIQDTRTVTQVDAGVYVIRHRSLPFEGGNTTIIIGDRDVFVVDAAQLPYAAREDIAQIRTLTPKPVRYLLNTHWHNDHVMGNHEYATAFPGVAIIAQVETKRDMDLNIPNAPTRSAESMAAAVTEASGMLSSGKGTDGSPLTAAERVQVESLLVRRKLAVDDYKNFVYQPPTLTFDRRLTIDLGGREVQIRHFGRGNTTGDAVVFLPKEKVVASGDLLVRPFPFPYDGYPSEWVRTLDRLDQLDAEVIIPGHGEIMRDKTYLRLVRDLFQSAIDQVNARVHVIGPAEFKEVDNVLPYVNLSAFRQRFGGDDANRRKQFDALAEQVVRLVFKEAALR